MNNKAYNMDCMDALREMPDKCFDLAVVDPPYGPGAQAAPPPRKKSVLESVRRKV